MWEEIVLAKEEEAEEERKCREENRKIMQECLSDAAEIARVNDLKNYQTDRIAIACALFEKRASHAVHWKEARAKEKFDQMYAGKN